MLEPLKSWRMDMRDVRIVYLAEVFVDFVGCFDISERRLRFYVGGGGHAGVKCMVSFG